MKSVLIIGCGWLGKITAKLLIKSRYSVTGTSRKTDKLNAFKKLGIIPFKLDVRKEADISIPKADVVLISISPKLGSDNGEYVKAIKIIGQTLIKANNQVIMCSSISVYNQLSSNVVEEALNPSKNHPNKILSAEGTLRETLPHASILRIGGLYGYNRHPIYFLSGRKHITNGEAPVNLIHADDVATIIKMVVEQRIESEVLNLVAPFHPTKEHLYTTKAKEFGLEEPEFLTGGKDCKLIDSSKLIKKFNYNFIHKNPLKPYN